MFKRKAPKATPLTHVIYLAASTLLGLLLSFIVHALAEMLFIRLAENAGSQITWYGSCALHPAIRYTLPVLGAVAGFFTGRVWWRMIYIEHRY